MNSAAVFALGCSSGAETELGEQTEDELPISQEQLADAVSLTPVHVNRTLMRLESEGISRGRSG